MESKSVARPASTSVLPSVLAEHAAEAARLHEVGSVLRGAGYVALRVFARHDERTSAHLDGLAVAGEEAWPFCDAALETASPGAIFAAAVRAIEDKQHERLERLVALAKESPENGGGFISAFGWVSSRHLQGIVAGFLKSGDAFKRVVGLAACAMHRVDPGLAAGPWLRDPDPLVRARALRAAGEIGSGELLTALSAAMADPDAECQFWAAWSAVLLGDRGRGLASLARAGVTDGRHRSRAFRLALQTMLPEKGHVLLQQMAPDEKQRRWLIEGSGVVGDPAYAPWLIKQMADDSVARLAGEAFTLITGADLDRLQLWRPRPEVVPGEPTENPGDENVEIDPDEGLMWPDQQKVQRWWDAQGGAFQPGARYFVGAPVTREHCIDVLKNGYQRQRTLAAHYLCLLSPGTSLLNTSAPAWRQQRLLAQME